MPWTIPNLVLHDKPVRLATMRTHGRRHVFVNCGNPDCYHNAELDVSALPDNVTFGELQPRTLCTMCDHRTSNYGVLLVSRVIAGLTQGPFFGIGAVVAIKLVPDKLAGQAVGQMFAGLTLANVLGVPAGTWIGNTFGWNMTFLFISGLGVLTAMAIAAFVPVQGRDDAASSIRRQLGAFRDRNLVASLAITALGWVGFMTFYGYFAPVAERIAGFGTSDLTWVLVIVGLGLLVGNTLGGRTADVNLRLSLILWPAAMIVSLIVVGLVAPFKWPFLAAAFVFGISSFANVPPMQMRVMKYGKAAPELAATANISAFNLANALGGIIGGFVVDSAFGAGAIPFAAAALPLAALIFILTQERGSRPVAVERATHRSASSKRLGEEQLSPSSC